MKVKFSGMIEINDDDVDGVGDVDHELLSIIRCTITDAENTDSVFRQLNLRWDVQLENDDA